MKRIRQSGSAIVELSFCLPVLVGLFLGALQFGYSFYVYSELEQSVRAGARYASLRSYRSATATPDAAYLDAVRNTVVYADPAGGTTPVAPALTTDDVIVTVEMQNGAPIAVTVAISNYRLPQIAGSVLLSNKPATRFAYMGVFAPPAN